MAIRTNFDMEIVFLDGRAGQEARTATAGYVDIVISGMDTVFHELGLNLWCTRVPSGVRRKQEDLQRSLWVILP